MPFLTTTGVLPVTCEVGLSRSVHAFHIMPGLPGPEGQLHDHDYRIEVVVDREQLDWGVERIRDALAEYGPVYEKAA